MIVVKTFKNVTRHTLLIYKLFKLKPIDFSKQQNIKSQYLFIHFLVKYTLSIVNIIFNCTHIHK